MAISVKEELSLEANCRESDDAEHAKIKVCVLAVGPGFYGVEGFASVIELADLPISEFRCGVISSVIYDIYLINEIFLLIRNSSQFRII